MGGRSIELGPDDPYTYSHRGEVFAANGDLDKAISDFEEAVSLNPNDITAYGNLIWLMADKGFNNPKKKTSNDIMDL